jgi:HAD superfamily phosphoserine phosphatase-like hydrolase
MAPSPDTAGFPFDTYVFDFDSTMVTLESLDTLISLAIEGAPEAEKDPLLAAITAITDAGMGGNKELRDSIRERLRQVQPDADTMFRFKELVINCITEGVRELIEELIKRGKKVFVISGGLQECILPVSRRLKIPDEAVFANMPALSDAGLITDFQEHPLAYSDGKVRVINQLRAEGVMPGRVCVIGDGSTDWRTKKEGAADYFVGFGGVALREKVREEAEKAGLPYFLTMKEVRDHLAQLAM